MAEQKTGIDFGSLLQGITGGVDLLTKKKVTTSNSGGTQTTTAGLDITNAGRQKLVQDLLESTSGLAETSSGKNRAGIYNSSTNDLLTNDLVDRITASVDRDTAKTVTNQVTSPTSATQVTPARLGLGDAALGIGGAVAAKKLYDIFSDSGAVTNAAGGAASVLAGSGTLGDILGSVSSPISSALDFGGFSLGGGGFPVLSVAGDLLSGKPEDALASGAGFLIGNALLPGAGGIIGSVLSDILPVGDIISGIGGGLFDALGSVVCTELYIQDKLSYALYINDISFAKQHMHPLVLQGYRYWGIPVVRLMRRSAVVTAIAGFFAINRAHYIAARTGAVAYSKPRAAVGAIINTVGVPCCFLLGWVLRRAAVVVPTTATV